MLRIILCCVIAIAAVRAADPMAGFQFTDGRPRTADDAGPYGLLVVRFCGVCPTAAEFMRTKCKEVHDAIERDHLPVQLVCATPDTEASDLKGWAKDLGYTWAWVAKDSENKLKVGTSNIYQLRLYVGGKEDWIGFDNPLSHLRSSLKGAHLRYPVDGLTGKPAELWWMIERGRPDAMSLLMQAQKSPLKADAEKILAVVKDKLNERVTAALAAGDTMDAFDTLDAIATECGPRGPIDLKPIQDRMTALRRVAALKDEFTARAAYQKCQALLGGRTEQERKNGKDGLSQIAGKYPATKYGRLSAQ